MKCRCLLLGGGRLIIGCRKNGLLVMSVVGMWLFDISCVGL